MIPGSSRRRSRPCHLCSQRSATESCLERPQSPWIPGRVWWVPVGSRTTMATRGYLPKNHVFFQNIGTAYVTGPNDSQRCSSVIAGCPSHWVVSQLHSTSARDPLTSTPRKFKQVKTMCACVCVCVCVCLCVCVCDFSVPFFVTTSK